MSRLIISSEERDVLVRRLTRIQGDVAALMRLLVGAVEADDEDLPADEPTSAPAPAPAPAPVSRPAASPITETAVDEAAPEAAPAAKAAPARKVRWRYLPGTHYRIVGDNPFRNGNNFNLWSAIEKEFGDGPFAREQVDELVGQLLADGRIDSVQKPDMLAMIFLRTAGADKGRLAMVGGDAPESSDLPPEPGESRSIRGQQGPFKLKGDNPFRSGINYSIWDAMGKQSFTREDLESGIGALVKSGVVDSQRPVEVMARDFLGMVSRKNRIL